MSSSSAIIRSMPRGDGHARAHHLPQRAPLVVASSFSSMENVIDSADSGERRSCTRNWVS